ncbi:DUF86 domain-containing protein [Anaerobacillus alkaliphilus]|uniref:DUF86 domain-containing protein n=1 Tax=Anaerobacillus alkaliphilus TaxID=1548597 RepID=A0A4Q0VLG1_9BACI|nr:DUF86 domain-containing protein [Anaerobacillus alkaliphilus]RXI96291.1 DUF86 domain-containing protein [Anaerobacillus alkaliphilus]
MKPDIILNKISIIERCLHRVSEVYEGDPENLNDFTKQDSIILNIQRTCKASIYLAMHIIAERKLGIPQHSRDAFTILNETNIISTEIALSMKVMVGFGNIAVHDYQSINLSILQKIIEIHVDDFRQFNESISKLLSN